MLHLTLFRAFVLAGFRDGFFGLRFAPVPVALDDILQRVVEGVFTEQLAELVATLGLDVVQNLRNNQVYAFFLQHPVNRAQASPPPSSPHRRPQKHRGKTKAPAAPRR